MLPGGATCLARRHMTTVAALFLIARFTEPAPGSVVPFDAVGSVQLSASVAVVVPIHAVGADIIASAPSATGALGQVVAVSNFSATVARRRVLHAEDTFCHIGPAPGGDVDKVVLLTGHGASGVLAFHQNYVVVLFIVVVHFVTLSV